MFGFTPDSGPAPAVRISTFAPGLADTDVPAASLDEATLARMIEMTPLVRIAQPEKMAETALLLLSKRASFITAHERRDRSLVHTSMIARCHGEGSVEIRGCHPAVMA